MAAQAQSFPASPVSDSSDVSPQPPPHVQIGVPFSPTGSFAATPIANGSYLDKELARRSIGQPSVAEELGHLASKAAPIAGAMAIGPFGAVPGAIGAGIGALVEGHANAGYENRDYPAGEQSVDFLRNAVLQHAGAGLAEEFGPAVAKASVPLKQYLLKTFFSGGKADQEGIQEAIDLGLNPTVGQATGSKAANFLENNFAGGPKLKIQGEQGKLLQSRADEISRSLGSKLDSGQQGPTLSGAPTTATGLQARTALEGNLAKSTAIEKAAYKKFETDHLAKNSISFNAPIGEEEASGLLDAQGQPVPGKQTTQQQVIQGPIYHTNSTIQAAKIKPTLDKLMEGADFQTLDPYQQADLKNLKTSVDRLTNGTSVMQNGQEIHVSVMDYNTAATMKSMLNKDYGGVINKNLQEGGLSSLAKTLDSDIDESVARWNDGKQALSDLNTAHSATALKRGTFRNEIQTKMYSRTGGPTSQLDTRIPGDPSKVFTDAYQSPEKADRLIKAMGPDNAGFIKGDYFDNQLRPKVFGTSGDEFNPKAAIDELNDPNSVTRNIYSSYERNSMLRFFKAANVVSPSDVSSSHALAFKTGTFALTLGTSAAKVIFGGGLTGGAETAAVGIGLEIGANSFTKNVLLNPRNAELASRLVKLPPTSDEAQAASKMLLKGLRGVQLTVGGKPATVQESGKVKLDGIN